MTRLLLSLPLIALLASPGAAQIGLPAPGQVVGGVVGTVDQTLGQTIDRTHTGLTQTVGSVDDLARNRVTRLRGIVRANPDRMELDDLGEPARRGVVLLLDPDPAALDTARKLGFKAEQTQGLEALGLTSAQLTAPQGMSLTRALKALRKALPGRMLSADPLHFPSGADTTRSGGRPVAGAPIETAMGLIDGGVGSAAPVSETRGFATGAPSPSDHGTAVAGLMRDAGARRIFAADVYGRDPAGGGALAIARALDWLVGRKVPVVSISLVGPRNPLLERAIAAAMTRGTIIVAAVGNDGPSAPPAYPASYPSVLAVTGVDGKSRALIEAGRALHLDYAAPGADISALNARGEIKAVRGTSYAAPLVAARAAAALDKGRAVRATLDTEARDLGRKGPDNQYGRGLICGDCAGR